MLLPAAQHQQSYFRDSYALKTLLDRTSITPGSLLFTSDATAMYTNIKTQPAIAHISKYLRDEAGRTFTHYNPNPSLKLSTLSSKTILLPSEIPTGNKSRAQGWAFHPPHHGQPSSMDSMRVHSSTGGDTELDSTVDSLMTLLASGSPTHVRTQMKNYGTTFKRTCKIGMGLNGLVNPSPHLLTLWI
eukprot:CCRYP_006895-RC/>CCRYP_006895-RC protein AED:0.33 eAED:0.54 QI:0/-1/0/1/-1/1/1/0/186